MIEIHFIRRDGFWWAYSQNDYGVVTHAARGLTQLKARAKLFRQFGVVDKVAKMVSEAAKDD